MPTLITEENNKSLSFNSIHRSIWKNKGIDFIYNSGETVFNLDTLENTLNSFTSISKTRNRCYYYEYTFCRLIYYL